MCSAQIETSPRIMSSRTEIARQIHDSLSTHEFLGDAGSIAYQDSDAVNIVGGNVAPDTLILPMDGAPWKDGQLTYSIGYLKLYNSGIYTFPNTSYLALNYLTTASLIDSLDKYRTDYKFDTTAIDTSQWHEIIRDWSDGGSYSLADNAVTVAKLDTMAAGWIDVRKFGAVGDGITDDTGAIQAALDYAAASHSGGNKPRRVFIPEGSYLISSIVVKVQTHLYGAGGSTSPSTHKGSTWLIQKPGTNKDLVKIDSTISGTAHWIKISDIGLYGDSSATYGNGILCRNQTGEGFVIERVMAANLSGSGLKFLGGSVPLIVSDCHFFSNDSSGIYYYCDELYESGSMVTFNNVSGDDNKLSLIWIRGKNDTDTGGVYSINNTKAETTIDSTQQNAIDILDIGTGSIDINGVQCSANATMNSLVRIRNSSAGALNAPHVIWNNLAVGALCSYYVQDLITKTDWNSAERKSFALGTDAGWQYYSRGSGRNFISVQNFPVASYPDTLVENDDSPYVGNAQIYYTANTNPTQIWHFADGGTPELGRELTIIVDDKNTGFTNGTNLKLLATSTVATVWADSGDVWKFQKIGGTLYKQIGINKAKHKTVTVTDSLTIGSGGVWMRNMYQSGNDLGIIFYNSALSRIDTVFAKQP
jgi:hypothetical protein